MNSTYWFLETEIFIVVHNILKTVNQWDFALFVVMLKFLHIQKNSLPLYFLIALAKELLVSILKFMHISNLETIKNCLPTTSFTKIDIKLCNFKFLSLIVVTTDY